MLKNAILILGLISSCILYAQKEEAILTVNGKNITKKEFLEVYLKNNDDPKYDKQSLEEYMDLYRKFQLIVTDAENSKLDTTGSLQIELKGYERQLAEQYLTDNNATEELIKEAYQHMTEEVRASHILKTLAQDASPEDTLAAYEHLMKLREEIKSGKKTFEEACIGIGGSEDPSAQENKGDLGYFGAFQMVYPFEKAAFGTKKGEVSLPIRTKFGYHIIYVSDRRPARGTIQCDHIMLMTQKTTNPKVSQRMIMEIYDTIQKGLDFKQAIMMYSEDIQSKKKGGVLPEFGTGSQIRMVPEFEEQAFSLKEDGEYTKPFKTSFGWHIVRRIKWNPVKPFEELKRDLKLKVSRDSRSEISETSFFKKLKKEYKFKDYSSKNLQIFYDSVPKQIFKGGYKGFRIKKDQVLFKFKGQEKPYTQTMFLSHLLSNQERQAEQNIQNYINMVYKDVVHYYLEEYEKTQLPNKYPKYSALMKEYREGVLLFELKNRNVWKKAIEDTTGLKAFFATNQDQYIWPDRIEAEIFECFNEKALKQVQDLVKTDLKPESIRDSVNAKTQLNVRVTSGKYVVEDKEILKGRNYDLGVNKVFEKDGKFIIVKVIRNIPSGPKELKECRGQAIASYQEQLEADWIKKLEKKYEVIIHKDVLHSLSK